MLILWLVSVLCPTSFGYHCNFIHHWYCRFTLLSVFYHLFSINLLKRVQRPQRNELFLLITRATDTRQTQQLKQPLRCYSRTGVVNLSRGPTRPRAIRWHMAHDCGQDVNISSLRAHTDSTWFRIWANSHQLSKRGERHRQPEQSLRQADTSLCWHNSFNKARPQPRNTRGVKLPTPASSTFCCRSGPMHPEDCVQDPPGTISKILNRGYAAVCVRYHLVRSPRITEEPRPSPFPIASYLSGKVCARKGRECQGSLPLKARSQGKAR